MTTTQDHLAAIEAAFNIRLPADYRAFMVERGGYNDDLGADFLQVYPADQLEGQNTAGDIQKRFPGCLAIGGDGSREVLLYHFTDQPPALVTVDIAAADLGSAIFQAATFTAFLTAFPQGGWRFE